MELASTIFLARPKQKRVTPAANSERVSSRWAISAMTVVYRTMGPATSWGNRATYRATFRGFFWMGASPRYTSMT